MSEKTENLGSLSSNKRRGQPEEAIRQALLMEMIEKFGFPKEMLVVERTLGSLPHLMGQKVPNRRFDIICFHKVEEAIRPLLLVECKAVSLSQKCLEQVIGYNHYAQAPFIALANHECVMTGMYRWDGGYELIEGLIPYEQMQQECVRRAF